MADQPPLADGLKATRVWGLSVLGPYRPEWTGPEEPGARSPSAWLERRNVGMRGTTNNRQAILCTSGFQLTDQISGWESEREHTAPNGKCKLLDVR
jgi:hypothetical protein